MPQAARITDAVAGTTAGEHTGHVPPHSPEQFSGEISGACSGTVRINGWLPLRWEALPPSGTGAVDPARAPWEPGAGPYGSTGKRRPAWRRPGGT